jgi:hypothetical protein
VPNSILDVWQQAAVVAVLLIVIYTGHKGWWYWSPGVRALTTELARERDDWRMIAVTLMRKEGIELPPGFEEPQSVALPGEEGRRRLQRADRST